MARLLPSIVLLGLAVHAAAQDSLFYANGMVVAGQVEEVGVEMVRYRTASGANSVVVVAEKRHLSRVKLAGGQDFIFNPGAQPLPASPEFLARDRAFSIDFIAPASNHVTIGYEQAIGTRMALTIRAGYIGLWRTREYYNVEGPPDRGALLKAGVKFILPPSQRRLPVARDEHPLAGWYLRPELITSVWSDERYEGGYPDPVFTSQTVTSAAMNLVVGRQVILGSQFTFDLYGGIGYGLQWKDGLITPHSRYREEYAYSHAYLGTYSPLTVSGGLAFGYLF